MNIIQIQDRLKGMPKEAIIGYVQNPTGEVPTYLALGELQRRNDVEAKYEAMKEPEQSVSEQIVQESIPQGIGSMSPLGMVSPTTGVGAPQPTPEMTPDMLTESGIGALPAGDIGQNFAEGGVIAFGSGGFFSGAKNFLNRSFGKKMPGSTGSSLATAEDIKKYGPNIIGRNPKKALVLGGAGAYYVINKFGEKEPISDEEAAQIDPAVPTITSSSPSIPTGIGEAPKYNMPMIDDPKKYGQDRMDMYREMIGPDEMTPRLQKRLDEMEERIGKREDQAGWLALTKAGLAMAGGESPYALQNIAKGAAAGVEDYGQAVKDIEELRGKAFDIDSEILKAKRAEDVAIASKGIDSIEAAEAHNRTMQLEEIKLQEAERERQKDIEVAQIGSTVYGYNTGKGILEAEKMIAAEMKDLEVERQNLLRPPQTPEKLERLKQIQMIEDQKRRDVYGRLGLTQATHPDDKVASTSSSAGWGDLSVSE